MHGADGGHTYLLDSPDGPMSYGRCIQCGEERDFPNSGEAQGAVGSWRDKGRVAAKRGSKLGGEARKRKAKRAGWATIYRVNPHCPYQPCKACRKQYHRYPMQPNSGA